MPLVYLRWGSKWYVLYLMLVGCMAVRITRWVVTRRICFAWSNPIFSVRAKYSGVTTECLEFATTLLNVPFLCAIFDLALPLLMRLGAASFTLISDTNRYSAVSATSESLTDPKIRSLSWRKSISQPLLCFLDISVTHASSPYGMLMYIVIFSGSHSTSPSVKTIWAHISNLWYDGT